MDTNKVTIGRLTGKLSHDNLTQLVSKMYNHMSTQGEQGNPLFPLVDQAGLYRWVQQLDNQGKLNAYIYGDGHLVGALAFDVVALPWCNHKCLQEVFVYGISESFYGFGRVAGERLKELAIEHDCSIISSGSAVNNEHGKTTNLYMNKLNYDFSFPCFVKLLRNINE